MKICLDLMDIVFQMKSVTSTNSRKKRSPGPSGNEENPSVYSVVDLLKVPAAEDSWIIKELIRKGAQCMIAGHPKCGKSLLASELALTLAKPFVKGRKRFLWSDASTQETLPKSTEDKSERVGFEIVAPADLRGWRVLVFSLEMRPPEVANRLLFQLGKFDLPGDRLSAGAEVPSALENVNIDHVFGIHESDTNELISDLSIVEVGRNKDGMTERRRGTHFEKVKAIIERSRPDVVIFDTLIQLHSVNENDNVEMKAVMRALRDVTTIEVDGRENRIAHVVIHHARKSGANTGYAPLTPDMLRGAGAVHGVVDLLMLARLDPRTGNVEINVSSRGSSVENFYLKRDEATLTFAMTSKTKATSVKEKKLNAFYEALNSHLLKAGRKGVIPTQEFFRKAGIRVPSTDSTLVSHLEKLGDRVILEQVPRANGKVSKVRRLEDLRIRAVRLTK